MSKLSNRVEKAKSLTWSHNLHNPAKYGTWGSKSNGYGTKYYHIELSHKRETLTTPDGQKIVTILLVSCQKDTGNGQLCNCPGNERHTICYHGLGALYQSFKSDGKLISFFESYESAIRMSFGGKVAKVQSVNGSGFVWAIVKAWPKKIEILDNQTNINLMRGQESDEGID